MKEDNEFCECNLIIGVPEGGGRRAAAWRVLLGYLPSKRKLWSGICTEKRNLYTQLVSEMILTSPEDKSPTMDDHPLNLNPTSQWQSYFKDNEVTCFKECGNHSFKLSC